MWLIYALLTIIFYAGLDFFIKRAAGKIDEYLGAILLNFFAIIPAFIILAIIKFPVKSMFITKPGLAFSILAGLSLGAGTLAFIKLFSTGSNLSLASPMVRIGIMLVTTVLGLLVLREHLSPKQLTGLLFAIIGLSFLVFK